MPPLVVNNAPTSVVKMEGRVEVNCGGLEIERDALLHPSAELKIRFSFLTPRPKNEKKFTLHDSTGNLNSIRICSNIFVEGIH
jgi:hypothetical protein